MNVIHKAKAILVCRIRNRCAYWKLLVTPESGPYAKWTIFWRCNQILIQWAVPFILRNNLDLSWIPRLIGANLCTCIAPSEPWWTNENRARESGLTKRQSNRVCQTCQLFQTSVSLLQLFVTVRKSSAGCNAVWSPCSNSFRIDDAHNLHAGKRYLQDNKVVSTIWWSNNEFWTSHRISCLVSGIQGGMVWFCWLAIFGAL